MAEGVPVSVCMKQFVEGGKRQGFDNNGEKDRRSTGTLPFRGGVTITLFLHS